jgi:Skp family chaperone for outer membrane proteins
VLCKNPSIGSLAEPVAIPTIQDSPIPTNGTPPSVHSLCNAITATGICTAPKTARQKFCKKCTGRIRVARLRAKNAPVNKLKVRVARSYHNEQRATSVSVREVGYDQNHQRAIEEREQCREDCKQLRAETKNQRDELKRQNKALTRELNQRITERVQQCDAEIKRQSELRTPMRRGTQ